MNSQILKKLEEMGVSENEMPKIYNKLDTLADVVFDLWLKDINSGKPQA